jgi:SNF2 family DNA or RNA helicase
MLIRKDKKALIFKLRNPSRVTTVIPTARLVSHEGNTLVAVPHRPEEVKVLRNLGFNPPDPMEYYYKWPGRFKPFAAQVETANFLAMHDRAFCLNSMGLGKTVTSLWAYDYMRECKLVKKALIVCPLSTMERTWADEVFKTFPHLDAAVLYGSRERRKKLLAQDADLYIINTDGIKTILDDLEKRDDIDLIIVDEIAMFRNSGTDRWKTLNAICNKQAARRVWGLTGAPTPHEPTDAWAQCRIVVPASPTVPKYFGKFRDMVMKQLTQFKWVPRQDAVDTVKAIMQPAVRFALDDCIDLPEQTFLTRDVEMTPEQKTAYKNMLDKLKMEYEGGQVLAVNEAVKANKLVQIACGVAYGAQGEYIHIPNKPRIDVLKELIEESEGKVLVFVPLTGVLENVAQELSDWYIKNEGDAGIANMVANRLDGKRMLHDNVACIHGGTSKNERDDIFGEFQKTERIRVIVANPSTMSHGLTLTAATTIIWYAPIHSNDVYEQACARVRRPGQTRTTVIAHIAGSDVERRIYKRLQGKQKLQGSLLDIMKGIGDDES